MIKIISKMGDNTIVVIIPMNEYKILDKTVTKGPPPLTFTVKNHIIKPNKSQVSIKFLSIILFSKLFI